MTVCSHREVPSFSLPAYDVEQDSMFLEMRSICLKVFGDNFCSFLYGAVSRCDSGLVVVVVVAIAAGRF